MCSVIRPPTSGPIASAIAETPAQIPIAVPRSLGGNVAEMIESVAGIINAEPIPCTARAPIRRPALPASPHASDDPVKIPRPIRKIRRRPNMSASLPPVSIRTAKTRAYALTIHSSSETPRPRSRLIEGNATFTTVLSSMIMNSAKQRATSVSHLRFSGARILAFIVSRH